VESIGIVLADNHPVFRFAVRDYLQRQTGFRILAEAENGVQALECVRLNSPDILLLEMRLPILDGVDVIDGLLSEKSNVKVLAFSAFSDTRYILAVIDLGGSGYLLKSEDPETLLKVLKRVSHGEMNFFSKEVYKKIQSLGYKLTNNLSSNHLRPADHDKL
jgi:DNA-binding NarL/FixJ family response regulator